MNPKTVGMLAWYNTKLLASYPWLLAIVLIGSLLFFLEPALMDAKAVGSLGEYLVAILGLLLFPHLSLLEEGGIGEGLFAKRIQHPFILVLRWLITALFSFLLIMFLFLALLSAGATFALFPMITGSGLTLLALGTFGMLISQLTRQVAAGYILAFAWYLVDLMTKGKFTGNFYLFGMLSGEWQQQKLWLALLTVVCVTLCAVMTRYKRLG
ncbi:MAG: hypothetical protein K6T85_10765 [Gorillibacterium sp.]|nr:hypothetical protein [Gorillibacterium sp.]